MLRNIDCILRMVNTTVSTIIYMFMYQVMAKASLSVKGFLEFFTLISALIYILNAFSFGFLIHSLKQMFRVGCLSIYLLLGIIPLAIDNGFIIIPTGLCSILVLSIYFSVTSQFHSKNRTILNGVLFVLNLIWAICIYSFFI